MAREQVTVADIYRFAQELRRDNPQASYKEIKNHIVKEFSGSPFPPVDRLTIPEQDDLAPEEDWTAGLPLVLRGIQQQKWEEIANGIILSLEQVENYRKESGLPSGDEWHNRNVGIADPTEKGVSKWMPEELMALAERNTKK
jgi:hypothetical protein